jgi:hypothetical protein
MRVGGFSPFIFPGLPASFTSVPLACDWPPAPFIAAATSQLQTELMQIASGALASPVYTAEVKWWLDLYFHENLALDPAMRDSVALLKTYWYYLDSLMLGKVCATNVLSASGSITTAQSVNDGISPTCFIEQNSKEVKSMILAQAQNPESWSPDSTQVQKLIEVARLCPITGGPAVYDAQSLLSLYGIDVRTTADCFEGISDKTASPVPNADYTIRVLIVPQPAMETFTLIAEIPEGESASWEVMNPTGTSIAKIDLQQSYTEREIHCQSWPAGIYLWKLSTSGGSMKTGRLVVIR